MKIVIANSKNWFTLNDKVKNLHDIYHFSCKENFTYSKIKSIYPDLIFFPHWNWIVPKEIYSNYKCIVFHTAPLPYGRGGSPIQNLILKGFRKVPVCALKMVKELDAGPIYAKKNINLNGPLSQILFRLNKAVNYLISELICDLPQPKEQHGETFTFKRLNKKDNLIPDNISLNDIFDRIRMLDDSSYPNPFINYGNFIIEFNNAEIVKDQIICKSKIILKKDYS